jgi:hypothetical protein
MFGFIFHL